MELTTFVKLDFPSGTVAACSNIVDITLDGVIYKAVGQLGAIEQVPQKSDQEVLSLTATLSGLPGSDFDFREISEYETYQGSNVEIRLGFTAGSSVTYSELIFKGFVESMTTLVQQETVTVQAVFADEGSEWSRPPSRWYTNEDQQAEFPGDLGMEFDSQMEEITITWGTG